MTKTTQEHIDGAAARFQADNANDDTKRATLTASEKAAVLRSHAEKCMQADRIEAAASWLRLAAKVERNERLGGGE
jgi:hypothetical protein